MSVSTQGRGKRIWLVAATAAICVAIAAAIFWRAPLAGQIGEMLVIRQFGIGANIDVGDIGPRNAWLARLSLGDQQELQLRDIHLDYEFDNFGMPDLQRIEVGQADIRASYDGSFHFGGLDRLLAQLNGNGSGSATSHPIVILHHVKLFLQTPIGEQQIDGMATYDKDTLFTNLNWVEGDNAARFNTTATIRTLSSDPRPEGQLQGAVTADSVLWKLLPGLAPKDGLISIDTSLTGGGDTGVPRLQFSLSMQGLQIEALAAAPIDGRIGGVLQMAGDERMPPQQIPSISFHDLSADLKGGISASFIGKITNGQGTLDLRGEKPVLTADIDVGARDQALMLGNVTLKEPTADLKLHLTYDGTNLVVMPRDAGKLTVLDLTNMPVTLPDLLTLPIRPEGTQLTLAFADDAATPLSLKLALGDMQTRFIPQGLKDPIDLALSGMKVVLSNDSLGVLAGHVTLPRLQIGQRDRSATIGDLQADFNGKPDQSTGTVSVTAGVIDLHQIALPLRGTAKLTAKPGRVDLTGTLADLKEHANLAVSGNLDLKRGTGHGHIDLAPLTFSKDGWQIGDLLPNLRSYSRNVDGSIALKGDVDLTADGSLNSDLKLAIVNLSGEVGPVVFQNVNGVVTIDHPWPLSTAPDQSLAVEQVVIGLPFTDGLIRFDVNDGKSVKIDSGTLSLAGGQVTLEPTVMATDAPVQQLNLDVDRLGVDELFRLIGIAGLSGEGQISGTIPVSLFPTGVVIKDAKLASTGPGKLKYDKAAAPAAVQGAGDSVQMALDALSDFHYKELVLTLQRQLTGDAALGLHISGANPSFYNGYPVEFNFTATGRLDEVLRKGLAGYQLPAIIEQRLQDFR